MVSVGMDIGLIDIRRSTPYMMVVYRQLYTWHSATSGLLDPYSLPFDSPGSVCPMANFTLLTRFGGLLLVLLMIVARIWEQ